MRRVGPWENGETGGRGHERAATSRVKKGEEEGPWPWRTYVYIYIYVCVYGGGDQLRWLNESEGGGGQGK